MRYTFITDYNQTALSVMARCLRKTVRAKRSKRSHFFGWIVIALALLLSLPTGDEGFAITINRIITWLAALVMLVVLIFEDPINGYFARKRMLKGTEKATAFFNAETADTFVSETEVGKTEFSYDRIALLAETDRYFVFIFSASHAQIYDKRNLSGGSVSEFRAFITEKTGKQVLPVK